MPSLESVRPYYPVDDQVHGFDHIERVHRMAQKLAHTEHAKVDIVEAAALLHDSQGSAPDGSERPNHHLLSAEFAEKILKNEGWDEEKIKAVQHCIRAHRFRHNGEEPVTLEAKIIFDADKLDVLGAIGAARTLGYALKAQTPFFAEPSEQFKNLGKEVNGELHSAYHEYLFKLRKISSLLYTKSGKEVARHRQQVINEFFEELAAEFRGQR